MFVVENKTLAGREPRDALDAQSRPLVVAFFEKVAEDALSGEVTVERSDKTMGGMSTTTLTCAELLVTLGFAIAPDPARSVADLELQLEAEYDRLVRMRWTHERLCGVGVDVHTYILKDGEDAETAYWNDGAPDEHKTFTIARYLERTHGWDRRRLWNRTLAVLLAALASGICPDGGAPGRGRGAGPGKGKGGRGRGGGARGGRGRGARGPGKGGRGRGPGKGKGKGGRGP